MPQAFLAWDTSHVLSMGSCCNDQRQPRRCGQSCASGHTPPSSCDASRGQPSPGSVAGASHRPPVTPCAQTGEPRVIENTPQTASTVPAGTDREPSDASSTSGHPHPADHHPRGGHSTRPGACPSGRGHSTPSGTAIPSPNARNVPGRTEMSPAAAPECGVFMPRPKTPVRRAGFDCRYSPPRQGVTRLLAGTRMAPVIYCTRVGCHWRRVGCTPGRWDLRAVRTTPGQ